MKKSLSVQKIALVGLMAALVFATSGMRIYIPLPIDKAAIHLGNVMCVLSGLLLGPIGGLASAIGSFFYDLTNPLYAPEAFVTFFNKFFIGFLAGWLAWRKGHRGLNQSWNIVGAVTGSVAYVALYLFKSFVESQLIFDLTTGSEMMLFLGPKALLSLINGGLACVMAVPLALVLRKAMDRSGLSQKLLG